MAEFSNSQQKQEDQKWWKPVLDGTNSHSRDDESKASSAAQAEVIANSLENEIQSRIVVDHREANSTLPAMLKLHGHDISLESLSVGDIRISDRVLIERKTARDLVDSLIDGRLIHQARRLHAAAPRPLQLPHSPSRAVPRLSVCASTC